VTNLRAHVQQSFRRRGLVPDGGRLLVAVSGGLDSIVLLHLLHALAPRFEWKLGVAHFNHQLRGRSAAADERFVRRLANSLGLPSFAGRAAVRDLARAKKLSVEMAARQARHAFLARSAAHFKADAVVLAHHADDQIELFFLRLLRGAGGEGLGGMKWRSPSPALATLTLIRPLLDVPRAALLDYARQHDLAWREDATNASPDILRNRIRHELLPLLTRRYQPAIARTVPRLMEVIGAEAECVRALAAAWLAKKSRPTFAALPTAVQRACLHAQLIERGILPDFDLIEALRQVPGEPVTVRPRTTVVRDANGAVRLRIAAPLPRPHPRPSTERSFKSERTALTLAGRAGEQDFGGLCLRWRLVRQRGERRPAGKPNEEWFDADAVGTPIELRHWRPGDRFQPIGLPVPAKLQDLLTNAGIPRARRRELVVAVAADGRLFWVEGLRLSEPFKLTPRTIRRLQWGWHRL
jgi:tRNA(Ile)-lysidine synthase